MTENINSLPIKKTLTISWEKTYGAKRILWLGFAILAPLLVLNFGLQAYGNHLPPIVIFFLNSLLQLVFMIVEMGMLLVGINKAFDRPINFRMLFYPFKAPLLLKLIMLLIIIFLLILPLLIAFFATNIFSVNNYGGIGILATTLLSLTFFGLIIYILIRTYLSYAFVLDKNTGPWEAIKLSFQKTRGNSWRLLGLILLQMILMSLSLLTVIPFIWIMPFCFVLYGVIYRLLTSKI